MDNLYCFAYPVGFGNGKFLHHRRIDSLIAGGCVGDDTRRSDPGAQDRLTFAGFEGG